MTDEDRCDMFAVTELVHDDTGETMFELEVLAGQFEGKTAYLDCWECVQSLMSLVMIAEGRDPDELQRHEMPAHGETVH